MSGTDQSQVLQNISKGNIDDASLALSKIIEGKKIRNSILKAIVENLKKSDLDRNFIIDFLIVLDEVTEKGLINEDFFIQLRDDPDFINKFLKLNGNRNSSQI